MKALFITHNISVYGAARSLQLLLNNYNNITVDLIVDKRLLRKHDKNAIAMKFGKNVSNICEFYLPCDLCWVGHFKKNIFWHYRNLRWKLNKKKIYKRIAASHYDFIHLNSIILHPLITQKYPFIIHIREVLDARNALVAESISKAKGVIFIDDATTIPFKSLKLENSIVLNNPIDMTELAAYHERDINIGINTENKTVFSVIGKITEGKGVHFIISSFKNVKSNNALLLIAGTGDKSYVIMCKKIAGNDNKIFFLDEQADIKKIYFISNYIVRGEPFFCIGRTMFEGLYAGCDIIIAGTPENSGSFFEYEIFKHKIHFYAPRDSSQLTTIMDSCLKNKIRAKKYLSNAADYISKFHAFVSGISFNGGAKIQ